MSTSKSHRFAWKYLWSAGKRGRLNGLLRQSNKPPPVNYKIIYYSRATARKSLVTQTKTVPDDTFDWVVICFAPFDNQQLHTLHESPYTLIKRQRLPYQSIAQDAEKMGKLISGYSKSLYSSTSSKIEKLSDYSRPMAAPSFGSSHILSASRCQTAARP